MLRRWRNAFTLRCALLMAVVAECVMKLHTIEALTRQSFVLLQALNGAKCVDGVRIAASFLAGTLEQLASCKTLARI